MRFNPPYLEIRFSIRAYRHGRISKRPAKQTYFTHAFTVDTPLFDPWDAVKNVLTLFNARVRPAEMRNIQNRIKAALKKAEDAIPRGYKKVARASERKVLKSIAMDAPLTVNEDAELTDIAIKHDVVPNDLLRLPARPQRYIIEYYRARKRKDKKEIKRCYNWLTKKGFAWKRYQQGNPFSLFRKPVGRWDGYNPTRRRRGW